MRHGLTLAALLLLPLTGCVVPPQPLGYGYGYAQPGYPGGYAQPGYPGAYPQADYGYPGFAYNDGSPTLFVEGAAVPLIFFGGGWGYYDRDRNWHRAPDRVEHGLNQRFPGGAGYRPWGGGQGVRPEGVRPEGVRPEGVRPEGVRPEGLRPEGLRPEGPRAGGYPAGGGAQPASRPAGPPPGVRPQGQAPVQRAAVPAGGHPEGTPPRHREDDHH